MGSSSYRRVPDHCSAQPGRPQSPFRMARQQTEPFQSTQQARAPGQQHSGEPEHPSTQLTMSLTAEAVRHPRAALGRALVTPDRPASPAWSPTRASSQEPWHMQWPDHTEAEFVSPQLILWHPDHKKRRPSQPRSNQPINSPGPVIQQREPGPGVLLMWGGPPFPPPHSRSKPRVGDVLRVWSGHHSTHQQGVRRYSTPRGWARTTPKPSGGVPLGVFPRDSRHKL
ncbi:hypothetical protein NDU88_005677 [Pleurodeles waltl]|uniref:Uncharacterized protein n=1 Tax=Pleurodeles waltl TaxID=8319 RepID=A0AAV7MA19_PLEWA|nr:hypothetical protein NDU88_005677 [Pleurodeles waltl]